MCSSFSVHEAYWIEELFLVLGEQFFWSLSCRECWLPFTCPSSWLCIGSTPPRGASGRSAGGACWGADCTEVAVHCRPVPPAPHTEGRVFPKGKVGAYLSRSGAPEAWLQASAKQAAAWGSRLPAVMKAVVSLCVLLMLVWWLFVKVGKWREERVWDWICCLGRLLLLFQLFWFSSSRVTGTFSSCLPLAFYYSFYCFPLPSSPPALSLLWHSWLAVAYISSSSWRWQQAQSLFWHSLLFRDSCLTCCRVYLDCARLASSSSVRQS